MPDYVITLVHGTFSPNAGWTQPGSKLQRTIAARLGNTGQVQFQRFVWRGFLGSCLNNGHRYRLEAGRRLGSLLEKTFRSYPKAQHWVVSHSHGGNVAFYALRNEFVQQRLNGIVTIASPFFKCHPRQMERLVNQSTQLLILLFGLFASIVLGAFATRFLVNVFNVNANWLMLSLSLLFIVPFLASIFFWEAVTNFLRDRQREIVERLSLPIPTQQRVLCLSVNRDEAGWWLKAWYWIAEVPHVFWDVGVYAIPAVIFGSAVFWANVSGASQAVVAGVLIFAFVNLIVLILLPSLTRAFWFAFGQETILDNMLVDISTVDLPLEASNVHEKRYPYLGGEGLRHSQLCEDAEVMEDIARFCATP